MITMFMPSERVLRAICWTLVHSCWQGMLLAILTGVVILLARRTRPAVRYGAFCCLLITGVAASFVTFAWELRAAGGVEANTMTGPGSMTAVAGVTGEPNGLAVDAGAASFWRQLITYFDAHANWIVAIWFLVFMFRLVRMMTHLGAVQRMRYYKVQHADAGWSLRLNELAAELGIRRHVDLLESALVRVPMMAGIFKPVILVPIGFLIQLSPAQVEAVLLHELAHIRRKDYLINLLFSFTENLFFFNPAMLWLSSLIREERESCCDDVAVGRSENKRDFISALLYFQEQRLGAGVVTPALTGGGRQLFKRVQRIIYQDNKVLALREKCFLMICLLVFGSLGYAFSLRSAEPATHPFTEVRPALQLDAKGMIKPLPVIDHGQEASVDTMSPEAKKHAVEALHKKRDSLDAQRKRLDEEAAKLAGDEFALTGESGHSGLQGNNVQAEQAGMSEQKAMLEKIQQEQLQLKLQDAQATSLQQKEMKIEQEAALLKALQEAQKDTLQQGEALERIQKEQQLLQKLQREQQTLQLDGGGTGHGISMNQGGNSGGGSLLLLNGTVSGENGNAIEKAVTPIIREMRAMKLISDEKDLRFALDKKELKINDVVQPAEIFMHFKNKYVKDERNKYYYMRKGESTSITVETH